MSEHDAQAQLAQFYEYFGDPENPDPLHPDLEPFIVEIESLGRCLKHPLVFEVPLLSTRSANRAYESKKAAVGQALAFGDWEQYMWLHERPYRVNAVMQAADLIEDDVLYWQLVHGLWVDSENIHEWIEQVPVLLESRRPGRAEGFMTVDERAALEDMGPVIHVWRGYHADRGTREGWSWTLSEQRAEWFARRFLRDDGAFVVRGEVDHENVIALVMDRGEDEIIVNPRHVRIVGGRML